MLSPTEHAAVEENLFRGARWIVKAQPDFPWHRDRTKNVTAAYRHSSQALALDLFATIDRLASRDLILGRVAVEMGLSPSGPWSVTPEDLVPRSLLGEPRSTQVDAIARGSKSLLLFECKFTEQDGGGCSQPIPISQGSHKGMRQCTGRHETQINPVSSVSSRCALTAKGIKYWEHVPHVLAVDPEREGPCPFKGGWYQWMRNLVAARAMAEAAGMSSAVVIVYAEGPFAMAKKIKATNWTDFTKLLTGDVPLRAVSYRTLFSWALDSGQSSDREILEDCRAWIDAKITLAGGNLARSLAS